MSDTLKTILNHLRPEAWNIFVAFLAVVMRWSLGFDRESHQVFWSFVFAILFVSFVAPAIADALELGPKYAAGLGVLFGLLARPLMIGLLKLAHQWSQDPQNVIRRKDSDGDDYE